MFYSTALQKKKCNVISAVVESNITNSKFKAFPNQLHFLD